VHCRPARRAKRKGVENPRDKGDMLASGSDVRSGGGSTMTARKPDIWMWAHMRAMLNEADELRGRFFELRKGPSRPNWEPPVDIIETGSELLIFVALPGVDPGTVEAAIDGGVLVVGGTRRLPESLRHARIHRMELPYGRFERHIALPPGRYDGVKREAADGCLLFRLHKSERT
jgi:HSP20 family protein